MPTSLRVARTKSRIACGPLVRLYKLHIVSRVCGDWGKAQWAGGRKSQDRGALLIALVPVAGAAAQEVHYSPEERLDAIDAALIATAKLSIDFASYASTDPIIIIALNDAEHRGIAIRIVLDPRQRHDFVKLGDLSDNVRITP